MTNSTYQQQNFQLKGLANSGNESEECVCSPPVGDFNKLVIDL